jgi:hypothetical protein
MIRPRPRRRRHRFHGVEAVHSIGLLGTSARREFPCVSQAARAARQEVGVERDDHVSLRERISGRYVIAECEPRAGARVVGAGGVPLMPSGLRVVGQHIADLRRQRGRGGGFGQDPEICALQRRLAGERIPQRREEGWPRPNLAKVCDRACAIRII